MTLPRQTSDDRPYATRGGFYLGDRVRMRLRYWDEPGRLGRVVGISPDELPIVEMDSGERWNADDGWLTRVEV